MIDEGKNIGNKENVKIRVNGEVVREEEEKVGREKKVKINLKRDGVNIVEIEKNEIKGEVKDKKKREVEKVEGIREKMSVIMV